MKEREGMEERVDIQLVVEGRLIARSAMSVRIVVLVIIAWLLSVWCEIKHQSSSNQAPRLKASTKSWIEGRAD